jgi:hypothetical protein
MKKAFSFFFAVAMFLGFLALMLAYFDVLTK